MLILLTHANHLYDDRKQVEKMQPYPPLQTLIAAAVLRERGHQVALHDATFEADVSASIDRVRPDLVVVSEDNFNFLTKMCLLGNREFAFSIARAARSRGVASIVNSSDSTDRPALYRGAGFDHVISGELEAALSATIDHWPGPAPSVLPIDDLNVLPPPAWDLLDVEPYRRAWTEAHGHFTLNLVSSRGCPYRCNWCAKPIHGSTYRHHSPERTADAVAEVARRFTPDRLWFSDDIFGLSHRWTLAFADAIERRGTRLPFKIQSRCDLMTRDSVDALARAGCDEVWMGAESGSQRILDAMDKGIRVDQIRAARERLGRAGIRACFFIQLGYLGETWDDIKSTIRMIRETRPDDIGVSVSYPLPNTRFHSIVGAQLDRHSNWSDSGDLAALYPAAFPSEVYRALAHALHLEVRTPSAAAAIEQSWQEVDHLRCACC